MTGHAQCFVRLMALKTTGPLSSTWFALSLTLALFSPARAQCPPATQADFNNFPSTLRTIPPMPLITAGTPTDCPGPPNKSPCGAHRVYVPAANHPQPRPNQLFLFLPGTKSEPDKYDRVLSMAAYAGYKTIGLSYNNTTKLETACGSTCGCYGPARREIVGGGPPFNVNSPAVAVQTGDTIVNRLYRLLEYLHATYGGEGWDAFLSRDDHDGTPEFTDIDWDSIVISGHSQGAGHALMITKADAVDGILLFDGGNDDCTSGGRTYAQWHDLPNHTPDARRSFNHDDPNPNDAFKLPDSFIAEGFGLTSGDFAVLDNAWPTPLKVATTNQEPPPGCTRHGAMANDRCLPDAFAGGAAAASPAEAYLFPFYVGWMCEVGN